MSNPVFLSRVVLRNYKSIGYCDLRLNPLTCLVGANGSGKSNFLDALHLVRDALAASLDHALNERGGLNEVRRHSSGHPTNFGIRLQFALRSGQAGHYAFNIGALAGRGFEVQFEECVLGGVGKGPFFRIERGNLKASSEVSFPAVTADRLALVAASGMAAFRPVFDALTAMGFYNLNPKLMRELQKPQEGRLLKPVGENIASVIGHLERVADMSDGTLRALGVLTALFQGSRDYAPSLVGIEEPETALHPAVSAALREALARASQDTQVIVTSHSRDLLDDLSLSADALLAEVSEGGATRIAPLDEAARMALRDQLISAGELLRLNHLAPDRAVLAAQAQQQAVRDRPAGLCGAHGPAAGIRTQPSFHKLCSGWARQTACA